jgi:alpha,alpha-trehalase
MPQPDFLSFDAWLFDLDGVVTDTAALHAKAWKAMFDEFLKALAADEGLPFQEFTMDDYHAYVDGKPRYDGVAAFLKSRGTILPWGDATDEQEALTVCGLGNRKNLMFNDKLGTEGATLFDSTAALLQNLKAKGKRVGIVTSSKNCDTVLKSVGMDKVFEIKVDGNVAAERQIPGKPNPDTYLEGAKMLGIPPEKCVVVEDAVSGVAAGKAGKFGLVLGIDRHGNAELDKHGADIVVSDLSEVTL